MRRLAIGLSTILQIHKDYAILFHERGVSQLNNLRLPSAYRALWFPLDVPPNRIWALVNLNPCLPEPAGIFKHPGTFFVVNATYHGSDRIEWMEGPRHLMFYMKPWSLSEVLQAYAVLASRWLAKPHTLCSRPFIGKNGPYTERQLRELYVKFGASPRSLAQYLSNPTTYEDHIINSIAGVSSSDLQYCSYNPDSTLRYVFVIWPSPTNRGTFDKTIASRYVFELL